MEKTYEPQQIEQRWYQTWELNGTFKPKGSGAPYCIMLPPPNVTGTLHMGHAFQDTIMDILVRYHRMRGDNTLWQPGMDHAGIATQMVVERNLGAENTSRTALGREKFVERVWQWKAQSGGAITQQMRRLGASPDWSRERFTMDEGLSAAVQEVFVKLYEEKLIYRGKRLVNWDSVLHTAVSDLEVISEEEQGSLWHLRYPLADGNGHLVVATTRPETMLGDAAVAVHPEDERYQHLIGKMIQLPLCDRQIPIIADDYVDREFGTGCVKITPAHDFNDYAVGARHQLELINILAEDAKINSNAPAAYQGLDRFVARKQVVADFEAAGLLEKIEPHTLKVPRGERSGTVIEPFLTDQWYVDAKTLAREPIAAVRDGRIKFVPENWSTTYFNWMENIEDWCISRQLWWGHRIPAWYDDAGNIYVARNEAEVRSKYQLAPDLALTQDEDVLDTWFSSALWPFSTLGWPEQTAALKTFYPTSVLVTGFDIIFFWVARMIMMGMHFMDGEVPFKEVYIHGLVRDQDGQKMSKSKGNVLDPIDLIDGIDLESLVAKRTTGLMKPEQAPAIEKATRKHFPEGIKPYGTDALRFTFAALATNGRDVVFDMGRVDGYRNFCNKIWNAARYVLMNVEGKLESGAQELSVADRWIRSRLSLATSAVSDHIDHYRFDLAAQALYEFIWNEFCDWYLELAKPTLNQAEASTVQRNGTRQTLVFVLDQLLRLMHPFMPFISEEIWQRIKPLTQVQTQSISISTWPQAAERDLAAEQDMQWIQQFLLGVRRIRAEMDIAPGKPLPVLVTGATTEDQQRLENYRLFLTTLGRIESIQPLDGAEPEAAVALVGELRILIPMAGLIDKDKELARLDKEIARLQQEIEKIMVKLSNPTFSEKAPAAVVQKERDRLADAERDIHQLQAQCEKIAKL